MQNIGSVIYNRLRITILSPTDKYKAESSRGEEGRIGRARGIKDTAKIPHGSENQLTWTQICYVYVALWFCWISNSRSIWDLFLLLGCLKPGCENMFLVLL